MAGDDTPDAGDPDDDAELEEDVCFFGVDVSGQLAHRRQRLADVADIATTARLPSPAQRKKGGGATLGVPSDVDPERLEQAGWGVVFARGVPDDVKHALAPLIDRRRQQAGPLFQALDCSADDTLADLQRRWRFSPGVIDPGDVPHYLLLVGDPTQVSFELQHALGVDFAVGRLDLASPAEYTAYAASVLRSEDARARPRTAGFFATRNPDDGATAQSCDNLMRPLAGKLANAGLSIDLVDAERATRSELLRLLDGEAAPALVLAACHGAVAAAGAADQRDLQGALITQEWPGPLTPGNGLDPAWRVAASDLGVTPLDGLVAMLVTCFGGGVPATSQYPYYLNEGVRDLAPAPFTSRLPQRLLARGAGAVIAHVERTWDVGFRWRGISVPQLATFRSMLAALISGQRVGHAMADFSGRYRSTATQFMSLLTANLTQGDSFPRRERAQLWMASYDARGWMILGDPAVRLAPAP